MNFWGKIKKYSVALSLAAAVVLILSAIMAQYFFVRSMRPGNLTSRFQKVILTKEDEVKKGIAELINVQKRKKEISRSDAGKIFFSNYKKTGIAFFTYENDSLVFWSTGAIPGTETPQNQADTTYSADFVKKPNGWFVVVSKRYMNRTYNGYILIKSGYPFENDYLHNDFQKDFKNLNRAEISFQKGKNNICSQEGKNLFSLKFPQNIEYSESWIYLLFTLYLSGLIFLIVSLYRMYLLVRPKFRSAWIFVTSFAGTVILIRIVIFYFHIPRILYHSTLFGPSLYSSSSILPSLGDFVVNCLLMLVISYAACLTIPSSFSIKSRSGLGRTTIAAGLIIALMAGFAGVLYCFRDLMVNSNIPLNLQNIAELNISSVISFLGIGSLLMAYFLLFIRLTALLKSLFKKIPDPAGNEGSRIRNNLMRSVIYLVIISLISTFILNHYNARLEKERRKILAIKIGTERDPEVEMKFAQMVPSFLEDKDLMLPLKLKGNAAYEDSLITELQDEYFGEYWNNYMVQITLCLGDKKLKIQPQNYLIGCNEYFQDLLQNFGKPTFSAFLYYLDYGSGYQNYLARIPIRYLENLSDTAGWAYIEINSKLLFKDLGYPELLVNKKKNRMPDISGYSYAFYRSGKLIHRVGSFDYPMDQNKPQPDHTSAAYFYEQDGMSHYWFPVDQNTVLILSKKADNFLDLIAPFSYLFFGFGLLSLLFFFFVNMPAFFNISALGLRDRLQLSMTFLLLCSLLLLGFLIIFYIIRLNTSKNIENLTDRTHSILVEMQHKYSQIDDMKQVNPEELNQLLTKFSNVFFSDINLYSPEGRLISTSRPQIFEEGLISPLMSYPVLEQFRTRHSSIITRKESIGDHSYYSSYIPFYNGDNRMLAYLNLPYFSRQEDLNKEISTFLIAFINIYVLLIIIGILIALLLAGYISYPLRMLTARIGKLSLSKSNEKLEWKREDEVGKLVDEYNRMTDELARNAEMLARSERETAWNEMARQIAHEIKNPLTPMMLSVEHLEKAWDENAEDWEVRLKRFTRNMKEQIETLSSIASEFSDFAKLPQAQNETVELKETAAGVLSLYKDYIPIRFFLESKEPSCPILADRKQIGRVLTNLINNSIQAIGKKADGEVKITLETQGKKIILRVTDNGSGMSKDQAGRVFQPNFTTKSGGTGLGLAIVRSIVLASGGDIYFETQEGEGTTFTLEFPRSEPNENVK